jgi:tetratricopeptide (TPR) repeat protein
MMPFASYRPSLGPPLLFAAALAVGGCAVAESASGTEGMRALFASTAPGAQGSSGLSGTSGAYGAYLAGRHAAGEVETAIAADQLLRAERLLPQDGEVVRRAFLAAVLDGRPDALRLARRLPDNGIAVLLVAGAEAQAGRWDRAEAQARALPARDELALLRPLLLAWTQAGRGQTDAALATLRPLVEGGGARGIAALHGAMIADLAGRGPEALRLVRLSLAEPGEPNLRQIQIAGAILLRRGAEPEALQLAARLPRGVEDLGLFAGDGGPGLLRGILAVPPVASATDGMAEAKLAFAGALRSQGAGEYALAMARLALRLRPDLAPALLLAAEALSDERQHGAAHAALARIAEGDPLQPIGLLRRAVLLDRMDRTAEAEALLRGLATAMPAAPQPWARLGDILRGRARFADALAAYDGAAERMPAPPGPRDWSLFYARGVAAERAGLWPRAEADFRRALDLSPEQPHVMNYLAYSWVEQGRNLTEARAMLERAVALRPQDGHIVDSLGWALFRLGQWPRAVELLERAVELEPRNATINDHLGDAYWTTGREAEARFQWRRALGLDPEPEERARIERKLREGLPPGGAATPR